MPGPYINQAEGTALAQNVFASATPGILEKVAGIASGGTLGQATAATVPPADLEDGSNYDGIPGVTYPNYLKADGQPAVVPTTYPNGDTVVNAKLTKVNGHWIVTSDPFNSTGLAKQVSVDALEKKPLKNWVDGVYPITTQLIHVGKTWQAIAAIVAGDVPGVSAKWDEILKGYAGADSSGKTTILDATEVVRVAFPIAGTQRAGVVFEVDRDGLKVVGLKIYKNGAFLDVLTSSDLDLTSLVPIENTASTTIEDVTDAFRVAFPIAGQQRAGVVFEVTPSGVKVTNLSVLRNGVLTSLDDILSSLNTSSHPLKGKAIWSIGDSHRTSYMQKLASITGASYDHTLNKSYVSGSENFGGFNSLIQQAYALINNVKLAGKAVDYIFIEDVHWFFSGTVDTVDPFLTKDTYTLDTPKFNTHTEANNYFKANYATVLPNYTPKANAVFRLIVSGTKSQEVVLKFSTGTVTTAGSVTMKFTDSSGNVYQTAISLDAGLTLQQATNKINEIQFSESGSKWVNNRHHESLSTPRIPFQYTGLASDADATLTVQILGGTTGVVMDGTPIITSVDSYRNHGFHSRDISQWLTPPIDSSTSIWKFISAEGDNYKWMKALVELLSKEIPTAQLVFFSMSNDQWDFATDTYTRSGTVYDLKYPDGSFSIKALNNTPNHIESEACQAGMKAVAEYYGIKHIDVMNLNGITPLNWKTYYNSMDVHPKVIGYDRVAETLANNI